MEYPIPTALKCIFLVINPFFVCRTDAGGFNHGIHSGFGLQITESASRVSLFI
jgi:hypothetical protein